MVKTFIPWKESVFDRRYSTKSNAKRAALRAKLDPDLFVIEKDGKKFRVVVWLEAERRQKTKARRKSHP